MGLDLGRETGHAPLPESETLSRDMTALIVLQDSCKRGIIDHGSESCPNASNANLNRSSTDSSPTIEVNSESCSMGHVKVVIFHYRTRPEYAKDDII